MANEKDNGGGAFPRTLYGHTEGMSLRDYFAGQALVLLSSHEMIVATRDQCKKMNAEPPAGFASFAYQIADAMLAERAK